MLYTMWQSCKAWGLRPPGLNRQAESWEDLSSFEQSLMIAFHQLVEHDEAARRAAECQASSKYVVLGSGKKRS